MTTNASSEASGVRLRRRSYETPQSDRILATPIFADQPATDIDRAWRVSLDQMSQAIQRLSVALENLEDLSSTATPEQVRSKVIEIVAMLRDGIHGEQS